MRLQRLLHPDRDLFNAIRRALHQRLDEAWAICSKKIRPPRSVPPFQGPARFSLVTVNFSTTYYLKLMLLTLCEQENLEQLSRIIIVDNDSRDGGIDFLERLASENERIYLIKNKFNCTHAHGTRVGDTKLN
jgi:hypothetical protein